MGKDITNLKWPFSRERPFFLTDFDMYYDGSTIVFLNGEWIKATEAKASLYNQTMHYGNGVFEGIRSYDCDGNAAVFKAKEHYERLHYSAEKMFLPLEYTVEQLTNLTYELLDRNRVRDAYIRPMVYSGFNMSLTPSGDSNVFIGAWAWGRYLGADLLCVTMSPFQRPNPKASYVDAKVTGHYTNSILATTEARSRGYDEALLCDANGYLAEGPGANLFLEKDGVLFTPSKGNILPGITRKTIIDLARHHGTTVIEKDLSTRDLYTADAAFFTGTAAEVASIARVDEYEFPLDYTNSIGCQLSDRYAELVRGKQPILMN